jgi:hypothetical protein
MVFENALPHYAVHKTCATKWIFETDEGYRWYALQEEEFDFLNSDFKI